MTVTNTVSRAAAATEAVAGSTAHWAFEVRDELMSLTLRMVDAYPEYPAGSVMRCVARAVRRAWMVGTPHEQIPARAEHAARRALARRNTQQALPPDTPVGDVRNLTRSHRRTHDSTG